MDDISGIILIDKPVDFTSFDVCAVLRKKLHTKKIGHAGTLDPFATGVLPILCGRATRLCNLLPSNNKQYTAVVRLGVTTDTLDMTGTVLSKSDEIPGIEKIKKTLGSFEGEITQLPPMYSAIKIDGKKLCDLARQGKTVEREPRRVTIYKIELKKADLSKRLLTINVSCSGGTYIRTLADDIGAKLGCGAAVQELRRTYSNGFSIEDCVTLADFTAAEDVTPFVIPPQKIFETLPRIKVSPAQTVRFSNGGCLDLARTSLKNDFDGKVVVVGDNGTELGVAEADTSEGVLKKYFMFE